MAIVWFLLVDEEGQAYRGTSADKVQLLPDGDVADFRNAVHAKNSTILEGIVPAQLVVYANREAFERKDNPVRASCNLVGLGEDEDYALLVVVPIRRDVSIPIADENYHLIEEKQKNKYEGMWDQ